MTWREEAAAMAGDFVKFDRSESATLIIIVEADEPEKVPSSFKEGKDEYHFSTVWNSAEAVEKGEAMIPGTWSVTSRRLLQCLGGYPNLTGIRLRVQRVGYGRNTVYRVDPVV